MLCNFLRPCHSSLGLVVVAMATLPLSVGQPVVANARCSCPPCPSRVVGPSGWLDMRLSCSRSPHYPPGMPDMGENQIDCRVIRSQNKRPLALTCTHSTPCYGAFISRIRCKLHHPGGPQHQPLATLGREPRVAVGDFPEQSDHPFRRRVHGNGHRGDDQRGRGAPLGRFLTSSCREYRALLFWCFQDDTK